MVLLVLEARVLTIVSPRVMMRKIFCKSDSMAPKYKIGQKVVIRPVMSQHLSPRDSDIEQYIGQTGKVADYYYVSLGGGAKAFYIYTVQIGTGKKEVVLHEDEITADIA